MRSVRRERMRQPSLPTEPLREGERVLTAGALELKTALANKLSEEKQGSELRRD